MRNHIRYTSRIHWVPRKIKTRLIDEKDKDEVNRHLKITTRLIDEKYVSVMGECKLHEWFVCLTDEMMSVS
jgi:hypothetical protein